MMFELGQKAYGKGMYGRAIEFLEGALTIIPRPTLFGGEVSWLLLVVFFFIYVICFIRLSNATRLKENELSCVFVG